MGYIIARKDNTSISCPLSAIYFAQRKWKYLELTAAIILITAGTSILIIAQ